MSDPAVEAAQRAWAANEALEGIAYNPGEGGIWTPDAMEAAAREALKAHPEFCSDCGADHSRIMQHEIRQIADTRLAELVEAHNVSMCGNLGVPGMPDRLELRCPTCGPIPDDGRYVFKQHASHVASIIAAFFREHFTEELAR